MGNGVQPPRLWPSGVENPIADTVGLQKPDNVLLPLRKLAHPEGLESWPNMQPVFPKSPILGEELIVACERRGVTLEKAHVALGCCGWHQLKSAVAAGRNHVV